MDAEPRDYAGIARKIALEIAEKKDLDSEDSVSIRITHYETAGSSRIPVCDSFSYSVTDAASGESLTRTVTVTVKADIKERNLFLVEVAQAGVFQIRNFAESDIEPVMMIGCANILFPYAREAVSDAITRAGFPSLQLAPVNFEALYLARLQEQGGQAAESPIIIQ